MRGQANTADGAELRSPICPTSEALVVQRVVRHCRGEESDPFCWPMPAAGVDVFGVSHWFAEHTSQLQWFRWDSESCGGSDWRQTTKVTVTFPWYKADSGKRFGASSQSSPWVGRLWLSYTIHFCHTFTIQLRNGLLLLHRIREDDTSKWWFFLKFLVSSWGSHVLSFFNFPICFKCRMTTDWLTRTSSATSRIVVRDQRQWCSKLVAVTFWWPATALLIFKALSPLWSIFNHHCTGHSLAVLGPNMLWCCTLSLLLYDPFWTQIKKSIKFAFCPT